MPAPAIFYVYCCDSPVKPTHQVGRFYQISDEFSKLPHHRDRRKKSPGVSASIGGDQIRRDRRIKSPGVSLPLAVNYPKLFMIFTIFTVCASFKILEIKHVTHLQPAVNQMYLSISLPPREFNKTTFRSCSSQYFLATGKGSYAR